jgi:KDO2-lipid IV(A) lauroyltransferase
MSDIRPEYESLWPRKSRRLRPLRRWLQYWLARGAMAGADLLPVLALQALGRGLGWIAGRVLTEERAVCEHQLRQAFPEMDARKRVGLANACFRNMGMTAMEVMALRRFQRESERWISFDGEQAFIAAHARGRGVMLVTSHSGNWELFNVAFNRLRIPALAIVRSLTNTRLNSLLLQARQSPFTEFMQRGSKDSPRQFLRALKQGKALIMAIDQDIDAQSVYVDFFGVPARTPRVAASLALRLGAPIVTGFDRRLPDGRHVLTFREIPVPEAVRSSSDPDRALTQILSDAIEAHVRAYPDQWAWNHRRWLHPPDSEARPPT